jgi:hypothetical protein
MSNVKIAAPRDLKVSFSDGALAFNAQGPGFHPCYHKKKKYTNE